MKIHEHKITIRDIIDGYDNDESGQVTGLGGMLNIRPPYQREYIYDGKKDFDRLKSLDILPKRSKSLYFRILIRNK
ncbi:MAG: hypothetical protein OXF48_00615 [Bacteroidetes bacterium]|nr:hypothetical protein [Bacteroidota bacterium]